MRWILPGVVLLAVGCDRGTPAVKTTGSASSTQAERAAWNQLRDRGLNHLVIAQHATDEIWRVECRTAWTDDLAQVEFEQLSSRGRREAEREAAFHCKDPTWSVVAVVDAGSKEEPAIVRWFWNRGGVRVSASPPEKGYGEAANAFLRRLQKQAHLVH
jgi:hypothetical protein